MAGKIQKGRSAYEIIMDSRKQIVDSFIEMMEQGVFVWQNEAFGKRPFNSVSGNIYKGANFIRLSTFSMLHGYHDPRWLTFKNIQDQGWHLKKGTEGVICEKWSQKEREKRKRDANGNYIKDANGKYVTDPNEKETVMVVSYFKVFNASCVEGIPFLESDQKSYMEAAYLYENSPIKTVEDAERTEYRIADDKIHMASFYTCDEAKYYNFFRELIKGTAFYDRVQRDLSVAEEALVDELGAVFLSADTSMKVWKENSLAYLNEWIEILKKDYNIFFKAAKDAEYAVGWIEDISGLEEAA